MSNIFFPYILNFKYVSLLIMALYYQDYLLTFFFDDLHFLSSLCIFSSSFFHASANSSFLYLSHIRSSRYLQSEGKGLLLPSWGWGLIAGSSILQYSLESNVMLLSQDPSILQIGSPSMSLMSFILLGCFQS